MTQQAKKRKMKCHLKKPLDGRLIQKTFGTEEQDFHLANLDIVGKLLALKNFLMK